VLILVASATVIGISYATTTTVKLISTNNLLRANRSCYLAESAIEHGLYFLRTDPSVLDGSDVALLGPFNADGTSDEYYFGSAPVAGQTRQYLLTGRAKSGGVTQTVRLKVYLESRHESLIRSLAPAHYWRLGEQPVSNTAADAVGDWDSSYKDNTSRGWAGAIMYDADTSAHLDGFNDRIMLETGEGENPDLAGKELTIVAWVWPDTHNHLLGHKAHIISKADGSTTAAHWWTVRTVQVGSKTYLRFVLKTRGTSTGLTASQGDVPLEKWTLAAVTYDGAHMRIYHNGVLAGNCAKTGDIDQDEDVEAWIGGCPTHPKDRPWHGRIDELAIFNRCLTAAQILSIYKARLPNVDRLTWNE